MLESDKTGRPAPSGPPEQIDASTGMPIRDAAIGVSTNASPEREAAARQFSIEAARLLSDDKCEDLLVLDLRGRSQVTDYFVIATGTSDRQIHSAAEHVAELSEEHGLGLYRSNLREARASWLVLDLVDVVVHVFTPEARLYYDLEMLWGDAARVEWQRAGPEPRSKPSAEKPDRNRAGLRPDDVPGGRAKPERKRSTRTG